jgi:hypothetical protein
MSDESSLGPTFDVARWIAFVAINLDEPTTK